MWHPWLRTMANVSGGKVFKTRLEFEKFASNKWGRKQ